MRELLELADSLSCSRPIFKLYSNEDGTSIRTSNGEHRYTPEFEVETPLTEVIRDSFSEHFSTTQCSWVMNKQHVAEKAMSKIRGNMLRFLERNLGMKSPRQTKIYRFYRYDMPNTYDFNNVIVMMYKHMRTFSDAEMKSFDKANIDNTIALMTAIMEKYAK